MASRRLYTKDRKFIVKSVLNGIPAFLIAEDLGVSRERVRQIFVKDYGMGYKKAIKKIFPERYSGIPAYDRIPLHMRKRYCVYCGKGFYPFIGSGRRLYCCSEHQKAMWVRMENIRKSKRCFICGVSFMPYRNSPYYKRKSKDRYFCGEGCYDRYLAYCGQIANIKKHKNLGRK